MKLHDLSSPEGAAKNRKRVGRGIGSGHGVFSGRGAKGQKARTGPHIHRYFEGGQLPLSRRLPRKRGFTNIFRTEFEVVNLAALADLPAGTVVTPETLAETGLVKDANGAVKILGEGELKGPLTVRAHRFSKSARAKITAAGGSFEEMWAQPEAASDGQGTEGQGTKEETQGSAGK